MRRVDEESGRGHCLRQVGNKQKARTGSLPT